METIFLRFTHVTRNVKYLLAKDCNSIYFQKSNILFYFFPLILKWQLFGNLLCVKETFNIKTQYISFPNQKSFVNIFLHIFNELFCHLKIKDEICCGNYKSKDLSLRYNSFIWLVSSLAWLFYEIPKMFKPIILSF